MSLTDSTWTPSSWRGRTAAQQPEWPDTDALAAVRDRLHDLPPLVFAGEARALLAALGEVSEGRAFLLQAGDCVESFHDVSAPAIRERLKVMLQMSAVLTYAATLPVVRVGRIAGQFAKPRTSPTEVVNGVEIPSFRGHIVHSEQPTAEARVPDPERLVQGYYQSASTLNLLRAFTNRSFGVELSPDDAIAMRGLARDHYPTNAQVAVGIGSLIESLLPHYVEKFRHSPRDVREIRMDAGIRLWLLSALALRRASPRSLSLAAKAFTTSPTSLGGFIAKIGGRLTQR